MLMALGVGRQKPVEYVTATVEKGTVRQLVSVSGIAEANQTAELAFPVSGIVRIVAVKKGYVVEDGDVLIELDTRALQADRQDALASLASAGADYDELLSGPSGEDREVTSETLELKRATLKTTKETETLKIENARRALLSSSLTAFSDDVNEDATPPTISGTYTCDKEGVYIVDVFSSAAQSGYSYRLSGLETGTYVASVDQAVALGACGLRIIFDGDSSYSRTKWQVEIPNAKSNAYVTNLNTYNLTVSQAASAIALAEQEVVLAEANAISDNAPARSEEVARADASVAQARARLARIDADIADRVLRAPFSGTITEIDILPGETVTATPVVTLLASSAFDVTARIPEIDIGKLETGQKVEMVFDARAGEVVEGAIDFISLKSTEIDGVAYYEAKIELKEVPPWIRSGLNADIDVVITEQGAVLRVPKRFVSETSTGHSVLLKRGDIFATTTVEVTLEGNDGFVAITGLNEGDIVAAP